MPMVETEERLRILTPDQRLRVFVSSTLRELSGERGAAAQAIRDLRLYPVMFEAGARPHPPREVYRSYLEQSQVFVGIYWQSYGWIAPGMDISGLEDEYLLSENMPRLIYVKEPAPERDAALDRMLTVAAGAGLSYKNFSTAEELRRLLADDLAILLTERFNDSDTGEIPAEESVPPRAPITRTSFVGREREVSEILDLLRDPQVWLVTLAGSGGIGKTRLALEVGRRANEMFCDGVAVVWLDSINDPQLVPQTIAANLDIRDPSDGSLVAAIADRLRDKNMLLVLDNFEHVISAAPLIPDLLASPGDTKVLVTTRSLLKVRGERAFEVQPLEVPETDVDLASLAQRGSVALFIDRAKAAMPTFALTPENAAAVTEICRRLEGVPLALELAAARVRMLPLQTIAGRLSNRLDLLRRGPRDLPDRQRTLRDTVRWSYELLEEDERIALQRMSVFAGGASLEAAASVMRHSDEETIEVLGSLIDSSLLYRGEDLLIEPWFKTFEMIGEYGRERLAERGELTAVKDRHAHYFLELTSRGARELLSPKGPEWYEILERQQENIQAAISWFIESGKTDDGFRLAINLQWFWWIRGNLSTADYWFTKLLSVSGESEQLRGRALTSAAMTATDLGDRRRGKDGFEDAIAILEAQRDEDGKAWAFSGLGHVLHKLGDLEGARDLQRAALETFDTNKDWLGQCNANTRLAELAAAEGDFESTEMHLQRSLAARRELEDPWGTGYVLCALGTIRVRQGDADGAEVYLIEALPLLRSVGSKENIARCLDAMGSVAALRDRWDEAETLYREALAIYEDLGIHGGISFASAHLARSALERGLPAVASRMYRDAFHMARKVDEFRSIAVSIEGLATALAGEGRVIEAARLLGAADGVRVKHRLLRLGPFANREQGLIEQAAKGLGDHEFEAARSEGRAMSEDDLDAAIDASMAVLVP